MLLSLALAPAAGWLAYAWGAHVGTLACASRGPSRARQIALTFDDGPDAEFTPRVLDTLDTAGVPGTFFLVGQRAARNVQVLNEMVRRGHEIANHGWSHTNLWRCGPRRTTVEIARAQELLTELTGRAPRHFRPPWGAVNLAMFVTLRRLRVRCVFWSIQPEGLRPVGAQTQAERVMRRAHPGAIVDLHDAEGTRGAPARLLAALPPMIAGLREQGYAFRTVTDLLAA